MRQKAIQDLIRSSKMGQTTTVKRWLAKLRNLLFGAKLLRSHASVQTTCRDERDVLNDAYIKASILLVTDQLPAVLDVLRSMIPPEVRENFERNFLNSSHKIYMCVPCKAIYRSSTDYVSDLADMHSGYMIISSYGLAWTKNLNLAAHVSWGNVVSVDQVESGLYINSVDMHSAICIQVDTSIALTRPQFLFEVIQRLMVRQYGYFFDTLSKEGDIVRWPGYPKLGVLCGRAPLPPCKLQTFPYKVIVVWQDGRQTHESILEITTVRRNPRQT